MTSLSFNPIRRVYLWLKKRYVASQYDDFTIADYLRTLGAEIGQNCRISVRNLGNEPYLVIIGDHVSISTGVRFITHDGAVWLGQKEDPSIQYFAPIVIGSNCFIGEEAMLLPGVTVGDNSIIAARALVSKDVPSNCIVAGVPARVIGSTGKYLEKRKKQWKEQKPDNYLKNFKKNRTYDPSLVFYEKQKKQNRQILRNHLVKIFNFSNNE
jgi:acetyltransferase-like isoleucine patch superfamily enzyme